MNEEDLKRRLAAWAAAHAGPQHERLGYCGVETLAADAAPLQSVDTPADEIEHVVRCLEESGRWREGRVLRAEYFMAALPEDERLQRLRRIGLPLSRTAYYVYLKTAKAFVLGALLHRKAA